MKRRIYAIAAAIMIMLPSTVVAEATFEKTYDFNIQSLTTGQNETYNIMEEPTTTNEDTWSYRPPGVYWGAHIREGRHRLNQVTDELTYYALSTNITLDAADIMSGASVMTVRTPAHVDDSWTWGELQIWRISETTDYNIVNWWTGEDDATGLFRHWWPWLDFTGSATLVYMSQRNQGGTSGLLWANDTAITADGDNHYTIGQRMYVKCTGAFTPGKYVFYWVQKCVQDKQVSNYWSTEADLGEDGLDTQVSFHAQNSLLQVVTNETRNETADAGWSLVAEEGMGAGVTGYKKTFLPGQRILINHTFDSLIILGFINFMLPFQMEGSNEKLNATIQLYNGSLTKIGETTSDQWNGWLYCNSSSPEIGEDFSILIILHESATLTLGMRDIGETAKWEIWNTAANRPDAVIWLDLWHTMYKADYIWNQTDPTPQINETDESMPEDYEVNLAGRWVGLGGLIYIGGYLLQLAGYEDLAAEFHDVGKESIIGTIIEGLRQAGQAAITVINGWIDSASDWITAAGEWLYDVGREIVGVLEIVMDAIIWFAGFIFNMAAIAISFILGLFLVGGTLMMSLGIEALILGMVGVKLEEDPFRDAASLFFLKPMKQIAATGGRAAKSGFRIIRKVK